MLQIEVQHINKDTLLRSLTRDHISTLAELLAGDRSQETGDRRQEAGDRRQSYRYKYRLATRPTGRWRGWSAGLPPTWNHNKTISAINYDTTMCNYGGW